MQVDSGGVGGFGLPAARDRASVRRDLLRANISREAARKIYGYDGTD